METSSAFKEVLGVNRINQIGIVVRNVEVARRNYSELFGITFPKVFVPEYFNKKFKGKPGGKEKEGYC